MAPKKMSERLEELKPVTPIEYAWVSEGSIRKLERAKKYLLENKLPVTEQAVKELYVKWEGLIVE